MKSRFHTAFSAFVLLAGVALAFSQKEHDTAPAFAVVQGYYHLSAASPCTFGGLCENTVSAQVCTYMGYQLFGKAPDNTCTIRLYKLPD